MTFVYKIWSRYDGFTPDVLPDRLDEDGLLPLVWKHYLDEVDKNDQVWVHFRGHGGPRRSTHAVGSPRSTVPANVPG